MTHNFSHTVQISSTYGASQLKQEFVLSYISLKSHKQSQNSFLMNTPQDNPSTSATWQITMLERQLHSIRQQKKILMENTVQQLIFLQNTENSLETIINSTSSFPIASSNDPTMTVPKEMIENIMEKIGNSQVEGILISENNTLPEEITLLATDASRGEVGSRPLATIACVFSEDSHLNLAAPSIYTTATETLEIEAIILGLQQAKTNSIAHIHLTADNVSALRFIKETIVLGTRSRYIQHKINFNPFFQSAFDKITDLKTSFSFLSISHTKSHTSSRTVLAFLNSRADSLAKAKLKSIAQAVMKADRNAATADTPIE